MTTQTRSSWPFTLTLERFGDLGYRFTVVWEANHLLEGEVEYRTNRNGEGRWLITRREPKGIQIAGTAQYSLPADMEQARQRLLAELRRTAMDVSRWPEEASHDEEIPVA